MLVLLKCGAVRLCNIRGDRPGSLGMGRGGRTKCVRRLFCSGDRSGVRLVLGRSKDPVGIYRVLFECCGAFRNFVSMGRFTGGRGYEMVGRAATSLVSTFREI